MVTTVKFFVLLSKTNNCLGTAVNVIFVVKNYFCELFKKHLDGNIDAYVNKTSRTGQGKVLKAKELLKAGMKFISNQTWQKVCFWNADSWANKMEIMTIISKLNAKRITRYVLQRESVSFFLVTLVTLEVRVILLKLTKLINMRKILRQHLTK